MQKLIITYKLNDSNRTLTFQVPNTKGQFGIDNKESIRTAIINTLPLQFISDFFMQRYSNDLRLFNEFALGIQKEYCPIHLHDVRIEFNTDEPFELRTTNRIVPIGENTLETIMNVANCIKEHFENIDKPFGITKIASKTNTKTKGK